MACGQLTKGVITAACNKITASGTEANVYLVNYSDVTKTGAVITNNVITSLENAIKGGKLYKLVSKNKATSGSATFSRGSYGNDVFDHSVTLRAFAKNQETKDFMNQLIGSLLMVIVENIEDGAYTIGADGKPTTDAKQATKYEIYGWESGLSLSELPFATELTDGVAYSATLASPEDSKEGQLPLTILINNSIEATKTALEALVAGE